MPVAALEIRVTEPPSQKVKGPLVLIVGVAGVGLEVTNRTWAVEVPQPFTVATSMLPLLPAVALMDVLVLLPVQPEGRTQM